MGRRHPQGRGDNPETTSKRTNTIASPLHPHAGFTNAISSYSPTHPLSHHPALSCCQAPHVSPAHTGLQAWNMPLSLPGISCLAPLTILDLHLLQNQPQCSWGTVTWFALSAAQGLPGAWVLRAHCCVVICTSGLIT